jgi:hypothetical protein
MEDIMQNNDPGEENVPEEKNNPFDDFVSEEQFSQWEATEEELFRCRIMVSIESFVGLINDFIKWCNTYVPNLKDLYFAKEDNRYFVNGRVVDNKGESIWKEFIDKDRQKGYDTEEVLASMEIDTFGYLDIMEVTYDLWSPIEVRIVNADERFLSFWGVLIRYIRQAFRLDYLKPEIWQLGKDLPDKLDLKVIAQLPPDNKKIEMKLTPGRKSDQYYDKAFERIQKGMDHEKAFTLFLKESGILSRNPKTREAFDTAMRRRRNPT